MVRAKFLPHLPAGQRRAALLQARLRGQQPGQCGQQEKSPGKGLMDSGAASLPSLGLVNQADHLLHELCPQGAVSCAVERDKFVPLAGLE